MNPRTFFIYKDHSTPNLLSLSIADGHSGRALNDCHNGSISAICAGSPAARRRFCDGQRCDSNWSEEIFHLPLTFASEESTASQATLGLAITTAKAQLSSQGC